MESTLFPKLNFEDLLNQDMEKEKASEPASSKAKVPTYLVQMYICRYLAGQAFGNNDEVYAALSNSSRQIVRVDRKNKTLTNVEDVDFRTAIRAAGKQICLHTDYKRFTKDLKPNPLINFPTISFIRETMAMFQENEEFKLKEPYKNIGFLPDTNYLFHRLPFEYKIGPLKYWGIILNNFTNKTALMQWVGSLFVSDSNATQYLWMFGEGQNGKTYIAITLNELLEDFVEFTQPPNKHFGDKYWTNDLLNKRLVVFDDCNDAWFVQHNIFKQITGGAPVAVEQKYKERYKTQLFCKFMFTSNKRPKISRDAADTRRIIYCEGLEKLDISKELHEKLKEEVPFFISQCVKEYLAACPDRSRPIPVKENQVEDLIEEFHSPYTDFIQANFNKKPGEYVSTAQIRQRFQSRGQGLHIDPLWVELSKFCGHKAKQKKVNGEIIRVFEGITLKVY